MTKTKAEAETEQTPLRGGIITGLRFCQLRRELSRMEVAVLGNINVLRTFTITSILLASMTCQAFAGELKITDNHGLIRSMKNISAPVSVRIQLKPSANQVSLVNIDGFSGDLAAQPEGNGGYLFPRVSEGTWQIKIEGLESKVVEVAIVDSQ